VICTIIFYFILGVNVIAPLLGGFLAGYLQTEVLEEALKLEF
jgi:hypothetical protein